MANCWIIPTNSTSSSIQQPKSPLWIGTLPHRRYPSIFILVYLTREKCAGCLFKNTCFLCWAMFQLSVFEIWHLRNIHTKGCYSLGSNTILAWKEMLLHQYSGNSVMKCRDAVLKNILNGFNSIITELTVVLPRSKFPMVLADTIAEAHYITLHRLQYSKCFLLLSSTKLQRPYAL